MLGIPLNEVIGTYVQDLVVADDAPIIATLLSGAIPGRTEARLKKQPAVLIPVQLSASPLISDGADCLCLVVTDIANLKRVEEQLRHLNCNLELLAMGVQKLTGARDIASLCATLSVSARRLTSADGATLCRREGDWCHYVDEDSMVRCWKDKRVPIDASVSGWTMLNCQPAVIEDIDTDKRVPAAAYKPTPVKSLLIVPIRSSGPVGAILCYWGRRHLATREDVRLLEALGEAAGVAMDNIQIYAELEQRVADRTTRLQAANKELEAFAYSVSHDLRAPLRALDGFSAALISQYRDVFDDQGKHYLERIQAGAKRMGQLIEDLLSLARISRRTLESQRVDLSVVAGVIAAELRAEHPQRQVECVIAPHLTTVGDPHLLQIALQNLFANAWKFTGACQSARIEFGVTEQDGERVYFVRDNGAGFDMAHAGKLFTPFQRLHGIQEFPGTGIGLATVQRIVASHGGRIWAEAAVNRGATFSFTLGALS